MFEKIIRLYDGSFIVYPGIGEYSEVGFNVTLEYPSLEQYGETYTYDFVKKYAEEHQEIVEEAPAPYEPTLEEQKEQWRIVLKAKYDAERIRLGSLLLMADDEAEEMEIKAQRTALKAQYDADLAKIEQGINPLEETE